jgi:hypothetical protein
MPDTSTNKRAARKSPVKTKRANKKSVKVKLPPAESLSYAALRVALDSFQHMALVYYGAGQSSSERDERACEIKEAVINAVEPWKTRQPAFSARVAAPKKIGAKQTASKLRVAGAQLTVARYSGGGCCLGYYDCNGFCIPNGQPCW